jgi:protein-tyrosine-phosphatase
MAAVALPVRAGAFVLRRGRGLWDAALPRSTRRSQRRAAAAGLDGVAFSSVTFVCQGNINRSAVAEHRWRMIPTVAGLPVRSAGLHPRGGRPSPDVSVAAAARLGVDLRSHRSTVASQLEPSGTLLVGFEPHHLQAWRLAAMPECAAVLLGVFDHDDGAPLHIPDPYDREVEYVEAVFRRVISCVDRLAEQMEPLDAGRWRMRS